MHQSIPKPTSPPPRQTTGECFEAVKSAAPGQNFSAKEGPLGQENTNPRGVF